jgi:hypothetical protein
LEKAFGVLFSVWRGTPTQGDWAIACLQGAWPKIIGDRLAGVSAPVSFDGSTLVIEVKDPQWNEIVDSVRAALLEKLRGATAGEIRKLRIVGRPTATPQI